jgi:hypothetical protein
MNVFKLEDVPLFLFLALCVEVLFQLFRHLLYNISLILSEH